MATTRWTPELLASLRNDMDPLADKAVAHFYDSGEVTEINRLLSSLIAGTEKTPDALPECLQEYLQASSQLPKWIDDAQVRVAEEVFGDFGVSSCVILACASLPECYMMRNGVHVLAMTQRLQQHAQRRVLETAQMIMAVMFPGGVAPNGVGVRTAQKVRLMHAAMRFLILHPKMQSGQPTSLADVMQQSSWNPAFGQPINQEDLLFTLMTFSHVGIRSLDRLGASLSDIQKDAYIHCWNVIGYVMGIREELLPADHKEAETLFEMIKAGQGGGTPEAQAMQGALIGFLQGLLPSGPLRRLPVYMTRKLVDNQTADVLGIPGLSLKDRIFPVVLIGIWRLIDRKLAAEYRQRSHLQFASAWFHDLLMAEIGKLPNAWNKNLFGLPSRLQEKLPPDWQRNAAKAPSILTNGLMENL